MGLWWLRRRAGRRCCSARSSAPSAETEAP